MFCVSVRVDEIGWCNNVVVGRPMQSVVAQTKGSGGLVKPTSQGSLANSSARLRGALPCLRSFDDLPGTDVDCGEAVRRQTRFRPSFQTDRVIPAKAPTT